MAGGMQDLERNSAKGNGITILDDFVGRRRCRQIQRREKLCNIRPGKKFHIIFVQNNLRACRLLQKRVAAVMVRMGMGIDDVFHLIALFFTKGQYLLVITAGIDDDSHLRLLTCDQITTDTHHADNKLFNNHVLSPKPR